MKRLGIRVKKEGGAAEISHMIGPAILVQQEIPVVEGRHPVVHITQNFMGRTDRIDGISALVEFVVFDAAFRDDQFEFREGIPDKVQIFKMVTAVPGARHPRNHGACLTVPHTGGTLKIPFLVVFPDEDRYIPLPYLKKSDDCTRNAKGGR